MAWIQPTNLRWHALMELAEAVLGVEPTDPEPPTAPEPTPTKAAKICPKCGKQYSRYWVRLYDRDIRYRHAGKRDATRDEDCYVPYETETTDTGVSVTPTTQTTNLKVKDEATK